MKVAYFDCFAGAGGDMIVASLLDAGCELEALRAMLARLGLGGYELSAEAVRRGGLGGTKFNVHVHGHPHEHEHPAADQQHGHPPEHVHPLPSPGHEHPHEHGHEHPHEHGHDHPHEHGHEHGDEHTHEHPASAEGEPAPHEHHHRSLSHILAMIDAAGLPDRVADRAKRIFERLGAAEAKVHRVDVQQVHFHEVGAVDSIVDIVGACCAIELLGIDRVLCSPIPLGSGMVRCEHGMMPVPAPATAELMRGVPVREVQIKGEATTPTAAAIFTTLSEGFGPMPAMSVQAIGYGAGTREGGSVPNLLRVMVGELAVGEGDTDAVVELAANVDDCTGEVLGATLEALLAGGALDAWASPIVMKKSRPAWQLCALCKPADADALERIFFTQTTTFGVRRGNWTRSKLDRTHQVVETAYGPVRVKLGSLAGTLVTASPEFEDCRQAAQAHHVSVREVMAAAQAAFRERPDVR